MESNSFVKSKSSFMGQTLCLMGVGILITFIVSMWMTQYIAVIQPLFLPVMILELVMVVTLVKRVAKMSTSAAIFWFLAYSAVNGVTLSVIFTQFRVGSLMTAFALTSIMFLCSGMIGITTKKDLTAIGQFAMMFVIGLIVLMVMQIFIVSSTFSLGLNLLGITIFCALTAYDMQKIKRMQAQSNDMHGVVLAALALYLDFVNLFLFVLRLSSGKK